MTEASENRYFVRLRAQVMCRDEGTGGWVAAGSGGLADVCVGKRRHANVDTICDPTSPPAPPSHEYYIHGTRINDMMQMVLQCTIKKDFQYHKVMPTFHHWVTEGKRFGLTFQTAADARAFDKGVRTAVDELLEGLDGAWPSLNAYKKLNLACKEDEDKHIFECLNLPSSSRSNSENSSASRRNTDSQTPILCAIALPTHHEEAQYEAVYHHRSTDDKLGEADPDRYPYVHLSAVHEYTYPQVGPGGISSEKSSPNTKPPLLKQDSGSLKKSTYGEQLPLPKKHTETFQARVKCRHCHEWYLESANRPGSCEFAPDCFKSCIDCVSCIKCAQCMVYHCMADSEGDYGIHPCACGPPNQHCAKRWVGVTLLSILVPCLCVYAPLRCAHGTAARARLAGGHHAPMRSSSACRAALH